MASDQTVSIRIQAVTSQFREGIRRAREAIKRLGRDGEQSGRELGQGFKKARDGARQLADQVKKTRNMIVGLTSAYGAFRAASSVFEAAAQMDGLRASMKAVAGSADAAAREFAFVRAEAERLGLPLAEAAKQYLSLVAAARNTKLEGEGVRKVFSALSEAAVVLNMSNDDLAGSLTAVQQMISKGTVSAEELRQQLGERLYGAFQIAARSIGISTQELDKALQRGLLRSEEFLVAFAGQVRKELGGSVDESSHTARRELNRLENAFLDLKLQIAEGGFMDALVQSMRDIASVLKDPEVISGARELGRSIGSVIRFIAEHGDKIDNVMGALAGASLGRAFGPWGMVGGAAVGAVAPELLPDMPAAKGEFKPSRERRIAQLERQIAELQKSIELTKRGISSGRSLAQLEQALAQQQARLATLKGGKPGAQGAGTSGSDAAAKVRATLAAAGIGPDASGDQAKEADKAREALERLRQSLQQQIATYGKSGAAVLRYRLTLGDLAETARKLGPEGEQMRQQLLEMARALEGLDKASAERERAAKQQADAERRLAEARRLAKEAANAARNDLSSLSADLRQQIALFGRDGPGAVTRYRLTLGDLSGAVRLLGDEGARMRDQILAQLDKLDELQRQNKLKQEGAELTQRLRTAQERYNDAIAHYRELLAAHAIDQKTYNRAVQEATKKLKEASGRAKEATDEMDQYAISAARGMQSAFADYLFDPFDKGIKGMLKGFVDVLRRMMAEAMAAQIGKKLFGDYGKTGKLGGWIGGILAGLFHTGGIAGERSATRAVHPLTFAGAPRYHRGGIAGLAPDEVPAILRRGEEVLTRNDPRHRANGGGVGNIVVNVDATGGSVKGEGNAAELGRQIAAAVRGVIISERRPGGLLAGGA